MSKSRVYFYLQKLKDRSKIDFVTYKNKDINKSFPIFKPDFPVLLLTENYYKKKLITEGDKKLYLTENKFKPVLCKNCKFYVDKDSYDSNDFYIYDNIGICTYKHNLFGLKDGIFSSVIRLDDALCGNKGKWFKSKD